MIMRTGLLILVALIASACAINQSVRPVAGTRITEICLKNNPKVHMSGFHEELRAQIAAKGIKTRTFENEKPVDCRYTAEYTANWAWDLAMYLVFMEMNVYDNGALIGQASYDARRGGANMAKFGTTAEKIRPLVDQLFASSGGH